jgi:hypothetical protein
MSKAACTIFIPSTLYCPPTEMLTRAEVRYEKMAEHLLIDLPCSSCCTCAVALIVLYLSHMSRCGVEHLPRETTSNSVNGREAGEVRWLMLYDIPSSITGKSKRRMECVFGHVQYLPRLRGPHSRRPRRRNSTRGSSQNILAGDKVREMAGG